MPHKFYTERFQELVTKEGYKNLSDFVNQWILEGGTFRTLYENLLLKGWNIKYITVWYICRKYLTISYEWKDYYWYKWNGIAKAKGYENLEDLMEDFKKKYTTLEISKEFNVDIKTIETLMKRLRNKGKMETKGKPKKRTHHVHRDKEGFARTNVKEKWKSLLESKGFNSFREAIKFYRNEGKTYEQIAKEFNVSERMIRSRIRQAKIKHYKRKRIISKP